MHELLQPLSLVVTCLGGLQGQAAVFDPLGVLDW